MNLKLPTAFYKAGFWTKKHSPELLLAGAIVTMAGSVVSAVVATTKLNKTLKPYNAKINTIKLKMKDDNAIQNGVVSVKECKKELTSTYFKAGLQIAKLYLPSVLCFGTGVTCMFGSHKIMKGRNLALAAAYTTLENGYNAYRQRVKDEVGDDAEERIYKDIRKEKVEVVDPKTGKTKTVTKEVPHAGKDKVWDVMWDCANIGWERDAVLNFRFLIGQQAYLNEKLRRQGYLFLSDVYDALGYDVELLGAERAQASHILGWIYDPMDKSIDSYVSFGLTQPGSDIALPNIAKQIEMNEPNFWLSLNVDGDILSGKNGRKVYTSFAKRGA